MVVVVIAMVLAVGVWLMTVAAAQGRLAANGLAGIRTSATQRSEEAWSAGHRAALPLVGWGGLVVLLAGVLALGGVGSRWPSETVGVVLLAAEGVLVVVAGVVADRAARRVNAASTR